MQDANHMAQAQSTNELIRELIIETLAVSMALLCGASDRRAPVWREEAKALVLRFLFVSRKTQLEIRFVEDCVAMMIYWEDQRQNKNTDFPMRPAAH